MGSMATVGAWRALSAHCVVWLVVVGLQLVPLGQSDDVLVMSQFVYKVSLPQPNGPLMNARLSTAIRIGDAARAIFRKTRSFPDRGFGKHADLSESDHIGVEPMLLALSMELALKAWFVFDYNDPEVIKSHDLIKLFDSLKPESQEKLDAEFKRSVVPYHPNGLYIDYSIRHILYQHKDAFIDWRYLHEAKKTMMFDQSAFEATLEMVLREFKKRYRIEPVKPLWPS